MNKNKKQTIIIFPIIIVALVILISLVFVFKDDNNDKNTTKLEENKCQFKMAYKRISNVIACTRQ